MGRCWTPSQRTPVQYNAGETRAAGERLGVAHSEVGTCALVARARVCAGGSWQQLSLPRQNGNAGGRRCRPNRKATKRRTLAQVRRDPAESKTPRMYRNSTRENREAQSPPAVGRTWVGGGKR